MRLILFLFLFITLNKVSFSQENRDYSIYKYTNFNIGYNYSSGEPNNTIHSFDLGFNNTIAGGRHLGGSSFGISSEFIFKNKFTIGPKINATLYYQFLVFGLDFVNYTDFKNISTRIVPFIGIGFHKFRITFNPQIILLNKNFNPVNKSAINITYNLTLNKKNFDETTNTSSNKKTN